MRVKRERVRVKFKLKFKFSLNKLKTNLSLSFNDVWLVEFVNLKNFDTNWLNYNTILFFMCFYNTKPNLKLDLNSNSNLTFFKWIELKQLLNKLNDLEFSFIQIKSNLN